MDVSKLVVYFNSLNSKGGSHPRMAREAARDEDDEDDASMVSTSGKRSRRNGEAQDESSEEEEEDEEPRLKYASMTGHLRSIYRNGDATSAFLVAGDKMVVGTHNGNIHVLSVPSLDPIRSYRAHNASISALSISPYPPPLAPQNPEHSQKASKERTSSPRPSTPKRDIKGSPAKDSPSTQSPKPPVVPLTPSNQIYIGSSSMDGNVCVQSLTDPRDVTLRNFGRPVKAVALSPEYRSDRSYLSGGRAGSLVLTTGGQTGTRSTATTSGAAAATSGWLGSIGLGHNTGKDSVLHSGEGTISTIKFSLSGKYVVWVNEQGIKLMRSNLHLESAESEHAWKRINHIDHPNRPGWEEMAGIWKAHVEWIDEAGLESDDFYPVNGVDETKASGTDVERLKSIDRSRRTEKLVVGWSGTIWIVNVRPGGGTGKQAKIAEVDIVTILRIDCIVSGISLYTPSLLLVLAYVTPGEDLVSTQTKSSRGVSRRDNALPPEMRIIDISKQEEVSVAEPLGITRFESLSATDYHMCALPAMRIPKKALIQRGALEAIGGGIEAIGGGIWDATMYPARLFTSDASVRSSGSPHSSRPASIVNASTNLIAAQKRDGQHPPTPTPPPPSGHGMKVFIHSPYDCVVATKPSLSDHYTWLESHSKYEDAWKLLNSNPEAAPNLSEHGLDTSPSTPTNGSLVDFFADDSSQPTRSVRHDASDRAEKEKLRVGESWLQQVVSTGDWTKAGEVAGQVLGLSPRWESWVRSFAQADKFDEIAPFVPVYSAHPPLSSATYEILLDHYIYTDVPRFGELLERWPTDLFDADAILRTVQNRVDSGDFSPSARKKEAVELDWRILTSSLAKLYLASGRPRKALGCYIQLQDADAAMSLISDTHLVDAVADDVPGFILLRVTKDEEHSADLSKLAAATLEPIRLLVSSAHNGLVLPNTVIQQLKARFGMPNPYLFFYFRALWEGDTSPSPSERPSTPPQAPSRFRATTAAASDRLLISEGRALVSDHADTALELLATYSRDLLLVFLKNSTNYTLALATRICQKRHYIPELVFLLSKEGRTSQALRLIIDELHDVSHAIAFAKEQNDASLWDDLIQYSMNKPRFIRGLLEEVGTSIKGGPLKLVQRIPPGLEIEGLREGLGHILREHEVQESISKGVARVLRGEVNEKMSARDASLRKGIHFDVAASPKRSRPNSSGINHTTSPQHKPSEAATTKAGHCASCGDAIIQTSVSRHTHQPHLLAFPCHPTPHVFHLSCLLSASLPPDQEVPGVLKQFMRVGRSANANGAADDVNADDDDDEFYDDSSSGGGGMLWDRSIGPKVDRARLLRGVLEGGCPLEDRGDGDGI